MQLDPAVSHFVLGCTWLGIYVCALGHQHRLGARLLESMGSSVEQWLMAGSRLFGMGFAANAACLVAQTALLVRHGHLEHIPEQSVQTVAGSLLAICAACFPKRSMEALLLLACTTEALVLAAAAEGHNTWPQLLEKGSPGLLIMLYAGLLFVQHARSKRVSQRQVQEDIARYERAWAEILQDPEEAHGIQLLAEIEAMIREDLLTPPPLPLQTVRPLQVPRPSEPGHSGSGSCNSRLRLGSVSKAWHTLLEISPFASFSVGPGSTRARSSDGPASGVRLGAAAPTDSASASFSALALAMAVRDAQATPGPADNCAALTNSTQAEPGRGQCAASSCGPVESQLEPGNPAAVSGPHTPSHQHCGSRVAVSPRPQLSIGSPFAAPASLFDSRIPRMHKPQNPVSLPHHHDATACMCASLASHTGSAERCPAPMELTHMVCGSRDRSARHCRQPRPPAPTPIPPSQCVATSC